ncbi:MAG: hypothetical protein M1838_001258, partial [Thelocarpon superellum]
LRNAGLPDRVHPHYPPNPPIIYGAHGQPLRTVPQTSPYSSDPGYSLSSPTSMYGRSYDEGKRGDEPHTPSLPPPLSGGGPASGAPPRRGSSGDYHYLDTNVQHPAVSPASSATSYHTSYSQSATIPTTAPPQPYYSEPRRSPPHTSPYPYERSSNSPHGSTSTTPGAHAYAAVPGPATLSAASATPPPAAGAPPPGGQAAPADRRTAMNIQSMLDGGPGAAGPPGRSARDHEMLDAFMPKKRA